MLHNCLQAIDITYAFGIHNEDVLIGPKKLSSGRVFNFLLAWFFSIDNAMRIKITKFSPRMYFR